MKNDNAGVEVLYEGIVPAEITRLEDKLLIPFTQVPPPGSTSGPDLVRFLNGTIVDVKKWRDPPHVAFANLDFDDPSKIDYFLRHFGVSGHFLTHDGSANDWFVAPKRVREWQTRLRD